MSASHGIGEVRYVRQEAAFPRSRRVASLLADLAGEGSPLASALLKAGAAALGVARIASDFHGLPGGPASHWLLGPHPELVGKVNPHDVSYEHLVPGLPALTLSSLGAAHGNAWAVVHLNEPEAARRALAGLGEVEGIRVLLTLSAPGGVVVVRAPDAVAAMQVFDGAGLGGFIAPGPAELGVLAAGLCLNEVALGGVAPADDLAVTRTIGFYSLHRPRRVDVRASESFGSLVAEVARPAGEMATFSGRRIKQVGAGALGNWVSLAIALDGGVTIEVLDGDPKVEPHNLNRQILLVDGLDSGAKAPVLAAALGRLDPEGRYTSVVRFVREHGDLGSLGQTDLLIAAPDNDAARALCGAVARDEGILFGQGGTGATGGQETVHQVGRACYRCVMGDPRDGGAVAGPTPGQNSCAVAPESVVSSNAVVAGLVVSELRQALAGRRSQNVRFFGDSAQGSRLARMLTDVACPHAAAVAAASKP